MRDAGKEPAQAAGPVRGGGACNTEAFRIRIGFPF